MSKCIFGPYAFEEDILDDQSTDVTTTEELTQEPIIDDVQEQFTIVDENGNELESDTSAIEEETSTMGQPDEVETALESFLNPYKKKRKFEDSGCIDVDVNIENRPDRPDETMTDLINTEEHKDDNNINISVTTDDRSTASLRVWLLGDEETIIEQVDGVVMPESILLPSEEINEEEIISEKIEEVEPDESEVITIIQDTESGEQQTIIATQDEYAEEDENPENSPSMKYERYITKLSLQSILKDLKILDIAMEANNEGDGSNKLEKTVEKTKDFIEEAVEENKTDIKDIYTQYKNLPVSIDKEKFATIKLNRMYYYENQAKRITNVLAILGLLNPSKITSIIEEPVTKKNPTGPTLTKVFNLMAGAGMEYTGIYRIFSVLNIAKIRKIKRIIKTTTAKELGYTPENSKKLLENYLSLWGTVEENFWKNAKQKFSLYYKKELAKAIFVKNDGEQKAYKVRWKRYSAICGILKYLYSINMTNEFIAIRKLLKALKAAPGAGTESLYLSVQDISTIATRIKANSQAMYKEYGNLKVVASNKTMPYKHTKKVSYYE